MSQGKGTLRVVFDRKKVGPYTVITSKQLPGLYVAAQSESELVEELSESLPVFLVLHGFKRPRMIAAGYEGGAT